MDLHCLLDPGGAAASTPTPLNRAPPRPLMPRVARMRSSCKLTGLRGRFLVLTVERWLKRLAKSACPGRFTPWAVCEHAVLLHAS